MDAVGICTPSGLHPAQAVQAMRAGKHVVVEKPMSLTLADADLLIETARETGVKVCVISQFRFSEAVQEIRRAIEAGAFGTIVSGSLQMNITAPKSTTPPAAGAAPGPWTGGGCLMNQGIHGVDMFRYLMGPVKSITALTKTQTRNVEVEDSAVAILEFQNGAVGTLEGSTNLLPRLPAPARDLRRTPAASCSRKTPSCAGTCPSRATCPSAATHKTSPPPTPRPSTSLGTCARSAILVDAILHGAPLMADAASGRPPLEVILGIYESSRTGRTVRL